VSSVALWSRISTQLIFNSSFYGFVFLDKETSREFFHFVTHIENCRCQFQNLIMICTASMEDGYVIDAHFGITNSASELGKFVNSRSQLGTK
jgi:hypothetical protein